MPDVGSLAGRAALVTGASRGIGRAIALAFAREGADVVVNYVEQREKAESGAAAIRALGRKAIVIRADVADRRQVEAMVAEAAVEFPVIDILVNNAGIYETKELADMTEEFMDRMLAVNLRSVVHCTRACLPHLRRGKKGAGAGSVINVSSVLGRHGAGGTSAYSAAKAGMVSLTESFAEELAPGIRVNCIAPGYVQTDMNPWDDRDPEEKTQILSDILLRRVGQPEDIAEVAVFLAGESSRWITGQTIVVDGGTRF